MHLVYNRKKFFGFTTPMLFFYIVFMFLPIGVAVYYSLTNYRGAGGYDFVGMANYSRLVGDKLFWLSLGNTLKITITTLIILIPLSFLLAWVLKEEKRGNNIFKTIFFTSYCVGGIIVGLVWTFILDPSKGLVNNFLRSVGMEALALDWIGGRTLTPYMVGIITTWSGLGFCILLWTNGIKQIPGEVLEASIVDGANKWQQVRMVTLPLLKETFKMVFVMQFTGALKVFESVYSLTGGGPNHLSETMVSYMYNTTFGSRLFSYGMAISVAEFVLAITVSLLFMYFTRKEVTD